MKPTCNDDCASACPFNYEEGTVSITSETAGSTKATSLGLYSFENNESNAPDNATLTIPACSVATSLTADISQEDRAYADVDVMLVLDRSVSMADALGDSTRIEVLQDAVLDAVEAMIDGYTGTGANLNIGITYIGDAHGTDSNGDGDYDTDELGDFVLLAPTDDEATIRSTITDEFNTYTANGVTPVYEALRDAKASLDAASGDVKYIILFTDGYLGWNSDPDDLEAMAQTLGLTDGESGDASDENYWLYDEYMEAVSALTDTYQASGIEFFTAVFSEDTCEVTQASRWSSMECEDSGSSCSGNAIEGNHSCDVPDNNITYSYSATTADEIAAMYEDIVSSMLDVTVAITDVEGHHAADTVDVGDSITLPFPNDFVCDDSSEQDTSIKLTFNGTGTITLSNIQLDMCAP
jgi:predicted enzyme related to lactoylglutathione lyase